MEAQRYPDDCDGIVAGAPAYGFTGLGAQFVKDMQVAFPDPHSLSTPPFTNEVLTKVEAQIVEHCDTIDGVKDGLLGDPRQCTVQIGTLTGVNDEQKSAGWPAWIVGVNPRLIASQGAPSARFAFGTGLFKNFVFGDPAWDYSRYEFSNFRKESAQTSAILNTTSPNLDAFSAKGHKLVVWHGWSIPRSRRLGASGTTIR